MTHSLKSSKSGADTDWLIGGGEMGELIASMDWSATPLGPRAGWPEPLKVVTNLALSCSFAMAILWGKDLIFVYNDAYRITAADKHPRALGRSTREIWPEVWEFNKPIFEKVMEEGQTFRLEDQLFRIQRCAEPEDAHFTLSYSPIWLEEGLVGGTLVTLIETTQRKRAEETLRNANQGLNQILGSIKDDLYVLDREWRCVHVGKYFLSQLGKDAKDFIGKIHWEMFPKYLGTILEENLRAAMEKKEIREFEFYGQYTDRWYRIKVYPSEEGITVLPADISELKKAEKLQDNQLLYRDILDKCGIAFQLLEPILNDDGKVCDVRYVKVNAAFEALSGGYKISDIVGRTMKELYPQAEQYWFDECEKVLKFGKPVIAEYYNQDTKRWYGIQSLPQGERRIVSLFTDNTERKLADDALRLSNQELEKVLNRSNRFSANAAHELLTPLTIIQGVLEEMAQHSKDGLGTQSQLGMVLDEVARLKTIVQKLLLLARADAGKLDLSIEHVDISTLIEAHIEDLKDIAPGQRVEMQLGSGIVVLADRHFLDLVIVNLTSNAVRYNTQKGLIRCYLGATQKHALFSITNTTDMPIMAVTKEMLFERFYRADNSQSRDRHGNGLGLSIVKEIVLAHGGEISVEEGQDNTITFTVAFPLGACRRISIGG